MSNRLYQASTLQALMLGYTKSVVSARELTEHGTMGIGTFEDVNGEMILLDGKVYRANDTGVVSEVSPEEGIPFAAAAFLKHFSCAEFGPVHSIEQLKSLLDGIVRKDNGINSIYIVRIDAAFSLVKARSVKGLHAEHISLSEILKEKQKNFCFVSVPGTMVCLYFPAYMDRLNAAGWHLHFISDDRKCGGHVFDLSFQKASVQYSRIRNFTLQLPEDESFDSYDLKSVSQDEVARVEQGKS